MRHPNRVVAALLLASAVFVGARPLAAQAQARQQPRAATPAPAVEPLASTQPPLAPTPSVYDASSANDVLNQLQQILNDYPPTVRQVLRLDPSLIDRPDYLAPYPRLAAFLQQHPEIRRNPSFFFGRGPDFQVRDRDPKVAAIDSMQDVMGFVLVFAGIMLALWMVTGLLRQIVEYRRWLRQSRVQADASMKVLDRLSSNEDLLAYLQTPAGVSLVQAAPMIDTPRVPGLPLGRILWSVQAGIVLAAFGVGLWLVKGTVIDEIAPSFAVAGTVAVCVGIGFVVSAGLAWAISSRLNLFAPKS
jgi:hypothetical protein